VSAAPRIVSSSLRALACALALGCASGPTAAVVAALRAGKLADALCAYEHGPADLALLRRIAALSLEREARGRDPKRRAQALDALQLGGSAAEPVLARLAMRAEDPVVRARSELLLMRRGDGAARDALRAKLDDATAEVRAAAVEALDPAADVALLRTLSEAPASVVRLAAVRKLALTAPDPETSIVLARVARHDPSAAVQVAALRALAHQGPASFELIEARLDDPQPALRVAAIDELVQLDYGRASQRLERYLAAEPSAEGIEAARVLSSVAGQRAPATGRSQLERALADRDGALRAAAAVALMSLHDPSWRELATARAEQEHVRGVRLCLALTLGAERPAGRSQLVELMNGQDVVAGEAAAELARHGDAAATARLLALMQSPQPVVRRIAVRALAQELDRPHDVRAALLDPDASVRIAAAGAILAAGAKS
jgi:HEAT repeat protein